jgi:DNA (cytosine-5)-methyltransferase 1
MKHNPDYAARFDVIYLDPPWRYGSGGARGGQFGPLDYNTMTLTQLRDMEIHPLCAPAAALFMWTTSPFMGDAIRLGEDWGFKYIRVDRVWAKTKPSGARHGVCGPWGMTDTEFLLLFTKGQMHQHQAVSNQWTMCWQESYPGKHSAKPAVFRDDITKRFPDAERVELFAREAADDWSAWGNEAPGTLPLFMTDAPVMDDLI